MSDKQKSVHGTINNYTGYEDDGSFVLVGNETNQHYLMTGRDQRSAQKAQIEGSITLAVLVRMHELHLHGGDLMAANILRQASVELWDIQPSVARDTSAEDIASLGSRIEALSIKGVCPHRKPAAAVIDAAMLISAEANAVASTPVI